MAKFACCSYCICAGLFVGLAANLYCIANFLYAYQSDDVMLWCFVGATSLDTGQRQPSNPGQCSRGSGQDAVQHAPAAALGPRPSCLAKYV